MRELEAEAGEREAADEVPGEDGEPVPEPQILDADLRAEHHAGGDDEELDDGVLEPLTKEGEDREPHRADLAEGRIRREREQGAERDHPVAEDRLHEDERHPPRPARLATERSTSAISPRRGDEVRVHRRAHFRHDHGVEDRVAEAPHEMAGDRDPKAAEHLGKKRSRRSRAARGGSSSPM